MLYHITRPIARIALKTFFKKVFFINEEVIPMNKPVILASNHPTAFIEPTMLACWLKRDLHFIVRGDLFVHPIYRKMLLDLNMIPIYRKVDVKDYADLKKNFDTLDYCYDLLGKSKVINILAEGNTIQEKRLRPLQKGTARMAFGAIEKYGEDTDIYIIPTGVNYTQADKVRTEVMIEFGEPIRVLDYWAAYKEHKNKAIRNLTKDLTTQLKPRIIIIDAIEDEEVTEHLFTLYRNSYPEKLWPITEHTIKRLDAEKQTAQYVNELTTDQKSVLKEEINAYFGVLEKHEIDDFGVRFPNWSSFTNTLILIVGFIPYVLGLVFNYIPPAIARNIETNKVKQREFKSPVLLAVMMGGFLIYYLLWIIAGFIIGKWQFWLWVALLPIMGYLAILYGEFYQKWKAARRFNALDVSLQTQIAQQRKSILERQFWMINKGSLAKQS